MGSAALSLNAPPAFSAVRVKTIGSKRGTGTSLTVTIPGGTMAVDGDTVLIIASTTGHATTPTLSAKFGGTTLQTLASVGAVGGQMVLAAVSRAGASSQDAVCRIANGSPSVAENLSVSSPAETLSGDVVVEVSFPSGGVVRNLFVLLMGAPT